MLAWMALTANHESCWSIHNFQVSLFSLRSRTKFYILDGLPELHPTRRPRSHRRRDGSEVKTSDDVDGGHCSDCARDHVRFKEMTDAERERYEERAAIIEYDGKLSRTEAERLARLEFEHDEVPS